MLLSLLLSVVVSVQTGTFDINIIDVASALSNVQEVDRLQLNDKHSERQKEVMDIAWDICQDNKFLVLLKGENGIITQDRKMGPNKNGTYDYGYCSINSVHKDIISDTRFLTDQRWQLQQCCNLYKKQGVSIFYAVDTQYERDVLIKNHFVWEKGILYNN